MFETYNSGNGKEVFICRRIIEFDDKCIRFHVIIKLFQRTGEYKMALLTVLASNILGLIAVFLGIILGKNIITMIK